MASLSYNGANNRINTPGFEYDPAGNQTRAVIDASGTQQQYRYDCAGRLAQVLDGAGNVLAAYSYGAGNQRLMSVEGGVTKFFAWAGGRIIAEYEASGANALVWKTSYVYLGGRLLATTSGAGGTETRFHHPDRLGTRLVTDAGGTVVTEQWTLPFGNMQPFTSVPGAENPYQHPTLGNPSKKRFTSYDRSDATGLDYAVNRFYSPQQGRFTQVDPIEMDAASLGNPQTLNMYAYCGNDPINHVDPDGLLPSIDSNIQFVGGWGAVVRVIIRVISAGRGGSSVPEARTPPTFPGNTPSISLGGLLSKISISSGRNVDFRTPPFVIGGSGGLRTPNTFPGGTTGVGGVSSFVSDSDEDYIRDPNSTIEIPTKPAYSSYWEYLKSRFTKESLKRDWDKHVKILKDGFRTGEALPMVGGVAGTVGRAGKTAYLYQKLGPHGEHLKYGITNNPATRYTKAELGGGRLKILTSGTRQKMLELERNIHETLPLGPEERQLFYIQKQIEKGLKP